MIRVLEDDPVTNAGTGSNLNLDGQVECDASIMNGTTLGFGSVGAVSDFKNPISVASKILQESDQGALSLGRIPPLMLVGSGATKWVDTMGFVLDRVPCNLYNPSSIQLEDTLENVGSIGGSLITKESLQQHIRFQQMLRNAATKEGEVPMDTSREQSAQEPLTGKRKAEENTRHNILDPEVPSGQESKKTIRDVSEEDLLQDTVGAICVDCCGRVASGVSSGGIAMKFPGRVSEAALFGAGCWAQDPTDEIAGFACSMTGAGEQISKTLLARTCTESLVQEDDISNGADLVLERFIKSPLLRSYDEKYAGFIAIKVDRVHDDNDASLSHRNIRAEFVLAHTTKTMGVAYMSTRDGKPTAIMSQRKPESNKVVSTRMIKL
ncbi:taspase, threonine aspartase, 1 [Mortierella polycephala]|uniref:Taspase, threonine aspartase, 1 n=1 Tax=Mortierella polycephala TaxID=41804 RepID=A0A9P6TVK7_9FUNG|nr:taspase, threonine aspartase, 1 [Mortierella polycephala]